MIVSSQIKELVRCATLAANGHNTQPWKFFINENNIQIRPDYSRKLRIVDPNDRALWISLGCALENLMISGRVLGYDVDVAYPNADDLIDVRLKKNIAHEDPLHETIEWRQCARSEYNGQSISKRDLDTLASMQSEPGVTLRFLTNRAELEKTAQYVYDGSIHQYRDKEFIAELITWLRFNKKEALSSFDGLYARCSGNPEVPRWLGQLFVSTINPKKQADGDIKKLRSSGGAVVIVSDTDDKPAWVRSGQVCERLALTMTSMDIRSAFFNQPLEVSGLREEYGEVIGAGAAHPQLLMRFGYGSPMPYSMRRPTEQVIAQSPLVM